MSASGPGNDPLPPQVVEALRCSVCGDPIGLADRTLRCGNRHSFDLARQGYVNLLHARIPSGTADTADMVAARADFLASGAYRGLADELARVCAEADDLVIDAGAGTGYYLARVLDASGAAGLALDVSAVALRRAAR
ncbi:putative RNA methyltransferase, partial [Amycolatopsis sp. SID8362]|uniref:putative RNA methyltransferase n=1 Tax=Amycolatopsis sp. SID8362 TaxID=2690346 RepID=UPI00142AB86E|nr:rRNA (guanine-N1)-methyltransferase [Amycolatopsis sp. SID8362]NED46200.1 rRNA (guanine-N1)-methyltransferase [Amycolatopsis sp. SID8362]